MFDKEFDMKRVVIETMRQSFQSAIDLDCLHDARVEGFIENMTRQMVVRIEHSLLANRVRTETEKKTARMSFIHPVDWWQSFRLRWFPAWWLARWPVKYATVDKSVEYVHTVTVYHVCPHVRVPDNRRHVEFLMMGDCNKCTWPKS